MERNPGKKPKEQTGKAKPEEKKKKETSLKREQDRLLLHPLGGSSGTSEAETALYEEWNQDFVGY